MLISFLPLWIFVLFQENNLKFINIIDHFTILTESEIYSELKMNNDNYLTSDQVDIINRMIAEKGEDITIEQGLFGPWFRKGGFGLVTGFSENHQIIYQFILRDKYIKIKDDIEITLLLRRQLNSN